MGHWQLCDPQPHRHGSHVALAGLAAMRGAWAGHSYASVGGQRTREEMKKTEYLSTKHKRPRPPAAPTMSLPSFCWLIQPLAASLGIWHCPSLELTLPVLATSVWTPWSSMAQRPVMATAGVGAGSRGSGGEGTEEEEGRPTWPLPQLPDGLRWMEDRACASLSPKLLPCPAGGAGV